MKKIYFTHFFILFLLASCVNHKPKTIKFYLGTSNGNLNAPIKLCELDIETKTINLIDSFSGSIAPSYINISPDGNFLYAGSRPVKGNEGIVDAYKINKETLKLDFINSQSSKGTGATHLSVHPNGRSLFVANYNSGGVASLPIDIDGSLKAATSFYQHEGSGPNQQRQSSAHAHFISPDPSGNFVLVVDLGADKVYIYAYNEKTGEIAPSDNQPFLKLESGAGPRHLVFHRSGKWFYVINELNSTLSACSFDKLSGNAKILKTMSTLPNGIEIDNYPAAVRIHKNGRFLYGSNRGHNSIALFHVDENGIPEFVETTLTEGNWPRDFNIDPSGNVMIVANQRGNIITAFSIDQGDGTLEFLDISKETGEPTCVLFVE